MKSYRFEERGFGNGPRVPNVPVIPPLPPESPNDMDPNPVVAICGQCGLNLRRVMGYVCINSRCPTGLGPARF